MFNKVIMIGNLTRDIELKYTPLVIAKSAIATSHKYKTQTGEQKEEVCFLDFDVFGKQAEILNQYVRKGSKVMLEGRLVLNRWTANDGSSRSNHSLRVENFKFLDSKNDNQQGGHNQPNQQQQSNQQYQEKVKQGAEMSGRNQSQQPISGIDADEIPF